MNHLFVTQDFGPDRGGMARRHVELARRFGNETERMEVSTVQVDGDERFDSHEAYPIYRQPFHFRQAHVFTNQMKWAKWLTRHAKGGVDVIHCGNIRPVGYAVRWASMRAGVPYLVYVNGGDLLHERRKMRKSRAKRVASRSILGNAAGIVATSSWVAELAAGVMKEAGMAHTPPIGAFDLGTDPDAFSPAHNSGQLRERWGIGGAPMMLTVARLVPHKGQDVALRALAVLAAEFPELRYVLVGEGHDEERLRSLARELGVDQRVIFAGPLSEEELPQAYATATVYVGLSRVDKEVSAEGFGISFLEASSSGLPVVAGDSGGVRSAVRDGETGIVVPATDAEAAAAAVAGFLRDEEKTHRFARAGMNAVVKHYNWDRVAADTRKFTLDVIREAGRP